MTRQVAFATPSLTHSVSMEFFRSSMQTDWLLTEQGWKRTYLNICGDQFIAKARNKLMNDFLEKCPEAECLFFLDDDLGWPAQKVLEFLERPEDILVGVYPKKSEEEDWPVVVCGDNGELIERDGLIKCVRGPTGFMRIKRHVIEEMVKYAPPFMDVDKEGKTVTTPAWFAAGVAPDGWFWTEDYIFCQNATACGFEIWADPNIDFEHRGNRVWKGNFSTAIPTFKERAIQAQADREKAEADWREGIDNSFVIEGEVLNRSDAA
jgi:hypothetical protein